MSEVPDELRALRAQALDLIKTHTQEQIIQMKLDAISNQDIRTAQIAVWLSTLQYD